MPTAAEVWTAITLGYGLLQAASGVPGSGFPRRHPTGAGARHWGTPFQSHTDPFYPVGTHEAAYLRDPRHAFNNTGVVIDVGPFFGPLNEPVLDKKQRLLLLGALVKGSGATNILFVFDPKNKDRNSPKDDNRNPPSSFRGLREHYQPPTSIQRGRRGQTFETITAALKQALDDNGFDWVDVPDEEGEAEFFCAHIARDPAYPFTTVLTVDMKDALCACLAPRVVDMRMIDGNLSHVFVSEPRQAAIALGSLPGGVRGTPFRESSIYMWQILYGNDDEPGHPFAYRPLNPFFAFQTAIRYLETRITADYPDALAVLIARVEGHIAFDAVQDMFWDLWIGSDVSLATDAGKMTRADARAETQFHGARAPSDWLISTGLRAHHPPRLPALQARAPGRAGSRAAIFGPAKDPRRAPPERVRRRD